MSPILEISDGTLQRGSVKRPFPNMEFCDNF